MHARLDADEDMPSHFWVIVKQGALSHFPQRHIICPVAEWPETNLENHSQYWGEVDFSAAVRAGKLIKANPVEEICCFLSTIYLYAAQYPRCQMIHGCRSDVMVWLSTCRDHTSPTRRPTLCWQCCRRQRWEHLES